jgi:hypothetical protein
MFQNLSCLCQKKKKINKNKKENKKKNQAYFAEHVMIDTEWLLGLLNNYV